VETKHDRFKYEDDELYLYTRISKLINGKWKLVSTTKEKVDDPS